MNSGNTDFFTGTAGAYASGVDFDLSDRQQGSIDQLDQRRQRLDGELVLADVRRDDLRR